MKFGTDGVRGVANRDLTPEAVLGLGRAVGRVIGEGPVLVGRDTRRSGPGLEAALVAGLVAEGRDVVRLGVTSTPVMAWWSAHDHRAAVMLSASHNAFADNGIKVFAPGGLKLTDDQQAAVEAGWHHAGPTAEPLVGAAVGAVSDHDDPHVAYLDAVIGLLDGRRLDGLRVVVDAANGSAYQLGPAAFERAGAVVTTIGTDPDGMNINAGCGSTNLDPLIRAVVSQGADLGVAFDGDADRLLAVDGRGEVVDGDRLLALFAIDLRDRGGLADDTVVVTVMTNLGFRLAMADAGISVVETAVGDRHVLAALEAAGWSLGGEQSGHIVFRDIATTGDGLLAALLLADLVARSDSAFADQAAAVMSSVPQVLINVPVDEVGAPAPPAVSDAVLRVEAELGEGGRILVRPSGTEPLLRIMVEAIEPGRAEKLASDIAELAVRSAE